MQLSRTFEITTLVILGALLLFDLAIVVRRPHVPSMREASLWVGFYVSLALGFGLVLLAVAGGPRPPPYAVPAGAGNSRSLASGDRRDGGAGLWN